MSMLYLAQTASEARPGFAIGYIAAKVGMIALVVAGLVKLVRRLRNKQAPVPYPPQPPNYWVPPHGYAPPLPGPQWPAPPAQSPTWQPPHWQPPAPPR